MEPVSEPAVAEMSRPVIARTALSRRRPSLRQLGLSCSFGDTCLSGIIGADMTDELDRQVRTALRRRRRSRIIPVATIVFAVCAGASAYLWINYIDQVRTAIFATPQATGPVAAGGEQPVSRAEFATFQSQTADSLQSAIENLEAQKADLKKLSDQMTDLVAKVDALRNAEATAPVSPPVKNTISAQPVVPPRPAALAQSKKPQAPRSTGSISVGGAPLPITPPSDR
jgi:cell division protein FtsB